MGIDFSVVIPTYNRAPMIGQTLETVLGQTYAPAEVIVIDDGGKDDTEAVVARYPSVRYVRVANGGDCLARNIGASHAKASHVAFVDSDDLWERDRLELQARLFRLRPDVAYCFTNFRILKDGQVSETTKFDDAPAGYWDSLLTRIDGDLAVISGDFYRPLLRFQPVFPSTLAMRREFFDRLGGMAPAAGRILSGDLEFTLRCAVHPPLGVVTKPVVQIRKHASNISGNQLRTVLGEVQILRYAVAHHPEAKPYLADLDLQIVRRSAAAADAAFVIGDFDLVRRILREEPRAGRGAKRHLKAWISRMPGPVARPLQRLMTGLGSGVAAPGNG